MGRPDFASAEPLLAAAARPTVTIDAPMDSDVEALQEGLERIRELLASPSSDMNHDLLNLIGAIRGYAEMLYEDIALLHPALKETLPAVLSAVDRLRSRWKCPSDGSPLPKPRHRGHSGGRRYAREPRAHQ